MFVKILNFMAVRTMAIIVGTALYIYSAVQQAPALRALQSGTRWVADSLEISLPDTWAVWIPILNLDNSLAYAAFVIAAYAIIEIAERLIGYLGSLLRH